MDCVRSMIHAQHLKDLKEVNVLKAKLARCRGRPASPKIPNSIISTFGNLWRSSTTG